MSVSVAGRTRPKLSRPSTHSHAVRNTITGTVRSVEGRDLKFVEKGPGRFRYAFRWFVEVGGWNFFEKAKKLAEPWCPAAFSCGRQQRAPPVRELPEGPQHGAGALSLLAVRSAGPGSAFVLPWTPPRGRARGFLRRSSLRAGLRHTSFIGKAPSLGARRQQGLRSSASTKVSAFQLEHFACATDG